MQREHGLAALPALIKSLPFNLPVSDMGLPAAKKTPSLACPVIFIRLTAPIRIILDLRFYLWVLAVRAPHLAAQTSAVLGNMETLPSRI